MNLLGDGIFTRSLGNDSGTGAGSAPPAPAPWSDMVSESLLLLELSESPAGATAGSLLGNPFCRDSGNPPGVTVPTFASFVADPTRARPALSPASCLAASSIENCSFAGALANRPCSSLARC